MPTFKAVVQKHQERRDGKFPVSIRVTHNRKSFYIPTGLYVSRNQVNKRTFEIKDQFVLVRTGQTIADYEKVLLGIDTESLRRMSNEELRNNLGCVKQELDFFAFCQDIIDSKGKRANALHSALFVVHEMGYVRMFASDFTSQFLFRFKKHLDAHEPTYKLRTKNSYLTALCHAFRLMQKTYNSEYSKAIPHDPFVGLEYYKQEVTAKRSLSPDELRQFFAIKATSIKTQLAQDICKLSFCLCGINLMDLVTLKKDAWDKASGRINYNRSKTKGARSDNAFSSIRIEPEVYDIFCRYLAPESSQYLFDFDGLPRSYDASHNVWMNLDTLCRSGSFRKVTPYWFRHSWATIARNECNVSKDDIDLCLNHKGLNHMADVYIKPDWSRIDEANRKVLDVVFHSRNAL